MTLGQTSETTRPLQSPAADWIWFNSPALAMAMDPTITMVPPELCSTPPLSTAASSLLRSLHDRGLTWRTLFDDPRLMAGLVLSCSPPHCCVVPTEHYFYFELMFDGQLIGGNLRLTDVGEGALHCGYYLREQPHVSRYARLTSTDGLCLAQRTVAGRVHAIVEDERTGAVVDFLITRRQDLTFAAGVPLGRSESLVSPIIDESGTAFAMLFDDARRAFVDVLVRESPRDVLEPVGSTGCVVGSSTRFVICTDPVGRLCLGGVEKARVDANTFDDGPFDQVPPDLALRPLILAAYPNVEAREGDTLDEHGNWQSQPGLRVAISPYAEYSSDDLLSFASIAGARVRTPESSPAGQHDQLIDRSRWEDWDRRVRENARHWPAGHDLWRSADH